MGDFVYDQKEIDALEKFMKLINPHLKIVNDPKVQRILADIYYLGQITPVQRGPW